MRIGLVDDDDTVLSFVSDVLAERGHQCVAYRRGGDVLAALQRETFDLLLIDWNMPDVSGMDVIKWAHAHLSPCPPILMLTSRTDKDDVTAALDAGADDFIVKPESGSVIAARVNAVLRRTAEPRTEIRHEIFGRYVFDRATTSVAIGDETVILTAKEFALALLLFVACGRPLSRTYILDSVWKNTAELSTRTLDMHISRVRSKLKLKSENGFQLITVFGYGYRLEAFDPSFGKR